MVVLVATGAAAFGGLLPAESGERTALVIDAAAARDGRELVDPRLRGIDADIRLPRTPAEARTNVRYFAAQDHRVVVAGRLAGAAADAAGVEAAHAPDLTGALAAIRR